MARTLKDEVWSAIYNVLFERMPDSSSRRKKEVADLTNAVWAEVKPLLVECHEALQDCDAVYEQEGAGSCKQLVEKLKAAIDAT